MNLPCLLAGAAALGLVACSSSGSKLPPTATVATFTTAADWSAFTLGPNDILRVGVYGHPELSAPLNPTEEAGTRVDLEGNLSLPLVGPVRVEGLTISEARAAITAAYAQFILDPKVDLSPIEYSARAFYVYGEVAKPGAYNFDRPTTVYQALARTGGFTAKANREQVVLLRGGPEDLEVKVIDAEQPDPEGYTTLRPDDLVFVRRTHAGKFSDEILPYLTAIASALSSTAALLLIDDRIQGN